MSQPQFQKVTAQAEGTECNIAVARFDATTEKKGTVVAVHGLTRQKRDFDFLAAHLTSAGYDVYAMDTPGRGDSGHLDPTLYHLDTYAALFADTLQKLSLPPVHWVGTSMGGLIAMTMGAQGHADLFRSLTLVDITHKPNATACARIADYVIEASPVLESVAQYLAILKQNLPLGDVSEAVWQHYALHQLRKVDGGYMFHFDPKIARLAGPALRNPIDITDGLEKITCPIALVAGGLSDLCTTAEIDALRQLKPNIKIHICPDAGHIPALADVPTQTFISDFMATAGQA